MTDVHTYRVARRAEYNGVWREDGLIPEAHDFYLIDNLVHTGFLQEVDVPEEEFRAAVAKLPADQQEGVLIKAGLHPDYVLLGERRTPHHVDMPATHQPQPFLTPLKSEPEKVPAKKAPAKKAVPKKVT